MKCVPFIFLCLTSMLFLVSFAKAEYPQLGKNPLKEIIAAMTLEEKANLIMGKGYHNPDMPEDMQGPVVGEVKDKVPGAAGVTYAIPRLGIPSIVLADGPAGLRIQPFREGDSTNSYYCTAFPIATLLASTWDTELVQAVGEAIGNELLEYGVDILLAPALNTHRNPLGGRNYEYFSEDPLISGKMAAAIVNGAQSQGVGTSLKHFVANNHEWNRNVIDVIMSQRALREIYLRGFEIAVRESQPWTIMTSYNKVNGTYTSENPELLIDILRKDWGFHGLVMTDWFAGQDAVAQMNAENDLLMPGTGRQYDEIIDAVRQGILDEAILDRNIENILNIVLKSPAFKGAVPSNKPDLKAHAALARKAGAEGMVLLKNNEQTLPVKPESVLAVFGNQAYDMITGGTGSGDVNEAYSVSLLQGLGDTRIQVHETLASVYQMYLNEEKAKQPKVDKMFWVPPPVPERTFSLDEIEQFARQSDMALITIGRNSGEFADRKLENDFYLNDHEKALIQTVSDVFHKLNKKVAVVLNIGGVIETASWRDAADAILLAWQPGQEAGNATSDVLSGKVNPCGKLATTFPIDYDDVRSSLNFPGKVLLGSDPENAFPAADDREAEIEYLDDIWVGYRHFITHEIETAYPFGFGLSYTEFAYGPLGITSDTFSDFTIEMSVQNTGSVAGKQVVQLYIGAPDGELKKPARELKAFVKTRLLSPGDSQNVIFYLNAKDLASFNSDSSTWVAEAGKYEILVGTSSLDIKSKGQLNLEKQIIVEQVSNVLAPQRDLN